MSVEKPLTNDEIFHLLSNSRRRYLLYYLERRGGSAELRDLARLIAADENETTSADVSSDAIRRVYISLYQLHVPNLEEYGIIEYDEETTIVSMTDRVDEMFDLFATEEDRWPLYYVAIALGGALVLGSITLDVLSVSAVPVAFLVLLGVSAMAVIQYIVEARSEPREVISELV